MKNKNHFVSRQDMLSRVRTNYTLQDISEEYKDIISKIEELKLQKDSYENLMKEENLGEESEQLAFKEEEAIYRIINYLARSDSHSNVNWGIDLAKLSHRLGNAFPRVKHYRQVTSKLKSLQEEKERILREDINFNTFLKDFPSSCMPSRHIMVRFEKELKCMYCGATTKEYGLTKEELDFLTQCAMKQDILLKEATKEDLPLLEVLMEELENERNSRSKLDPFDENNASKLEEESNEEEHRVLELRVQIKTAHLLDAKKYKNETMRELCPRYFSDEKAKELLSNVEKELKKLQNSDSRFKSLIIEEWKAAKYEILILSGAHIPTLLEQAQTEEDKIALTKGYYNLLNPERRIRSGYFNPSIYNRDAYCYDYCITSNKEINNRILEMKVRR